MGNIILCRPKQSILNSKYAAYYLVISSKNLQNTSRGSSQKGLYLSQMRDFQIPLPPLEVQKKVAQTLDAASELVALRRKQLAELDSLIKAIFYEMFGDPVVNEKGWEVKNLNDICCEIIDCPHSTPTHSEAPTIYPAIPTSEIQNGNINWSSMKYVSEIEYLKSVKRIKPEANDIIYGREGSYGDAVILPSGYNFSWAKE